MSSWKNYGDVNFLSEGGCMVRHAWSEEERQQYPSLEDEYDVLMLVPSFEEEDMVYAALKVVCIGDCDTEGLTSVFGTLPEDPMLLAAYNAVYTGFEPGIDRAYRQRGMYSTNEDMLISSEEARAWLKELEVPEELIAAQ